MNFSHFRLLFIIPFLLVLVVFFINRNKLQLRIPSDILLPLNDKEIKKNKIRYYLPVIIFCLALILLMIALANPQKMLTNQKTNVEGISIMLAIDLSGSMEAEDFVPKNRITVSKKVISDFIRHRDNDLIGAVVFGTYAFLMSPLTVDYALLQNQINSLEIGQIEGQTAIGDAIVKAVNHLRNSATKSKIIILSTDGESNTGDVDPITAAHLAAAVGIKVYTIGIGKPGGAPVPYIHPVFGKQYYRNPDGSIYLTKLDEETLKKIADITGGIYFRAIDAESLSQVYQYIDRLERTKIETKTTVKFRSEYFIFAFLGFIFYIIYLVYDFYFLKVNR
ncbi:MAG: VWA domain-containing protein [Candidatus Margulisbacteria bacterium]|nr:VWA domain-containing protein [Candidatus Margulisiibacteriota bacterium]